RRAEVERIRLQRHVPTRLDGGAFENRLVGGGALDRASDLDVRDHRLARVLGGFRVLVVVTDLQPCRNAGTGLGFAAGVCLGLRTRVGVQADLARVRRRFAARPRLIARRVAFDRVGALREIAADLDVCTHVDNTVLRGPRLVAACLDARLARRSLVLCGAFLGVLFIVACARRLPALSLYAT